MNAKLSRVGWLRWAAMAPLISFLTTGIAVASPPQGQQEQVRAFLEAGEFAPALDLARQTGDAGQRDALLSEIVQAQASAGARDASLQSASEIRDDRVRAGALGRSGRRNAGRSGRRVASRLQRADRLDQIDDQTHQLG